MLDGKSVLVTGGTGSFGKKFVELVLKRYKLERLIIFSRDELKQFEMAQTFPEGEHRCLRYFLGDVRDQERLHRAFQGVDVVVHAAALKQVPAAEYNPFEAVKTNVIGAQNIINAAIDQKVEKVIALSTDKAANPVNLYGATKLCADKLFIAGNAYVGREGTTFSVVRYGNVAGSRGSVIPLFHRQKASGVLTITDTRMTRFWITLEQCVDFVLQSLRIMVGGEIFVPKIPSMSVADLAKAICPDCAIKIIGIRPGEKLHEVLISKDDARHTKAYDDYYVILPNFNYISNKFDHDGGAPTPEDFEYNSGTNAWLLTPEEILQMAL